MPEKDIHSAILITPERLMDGTIVVDSMGRFPAWCEYRTGDRKFEIWVIISPCKIESGDLNARYWTDRPTDEQCRETPWTYPLPIRIR